jgi:hypothetical protein
VGVQYDPSCMREAKTRHLFGISDCFKVLLFVLILYISDQFVLYFFPLNPSEDTEDFK